MGNGNYDHERITDQKSIFLPMFCRLSIKDVKQNTVPIAAAAEPSSPKVSCIGQVKKNNRVIGFPTPTATAVTAAYHHKHAKPKKILCSTKTLLPNPTTMNAAAKGASGGRRSGSRSCRTNKEMRGSNFRRSRATSNFDHSGDRDCGKVVVVDVGAMDPPLPVVKRVASPGVGRDELNIWKRRLNGVKGLQIEPIHLPMNKFHPPPTTL